jgi:predicted AAA+ superfamily ATPase
LEDRAVVINLLRVPIQSRLLRNPGDLEGLIDAAPVKTRKRVVSDEIQKVPALLDEVHRLIEERGTHFVLSGSSARKLKATGVNLLGGRAWVSHLHSLTAAEIPRFDLERMLRYGGLPHVYLSEFPDQELEAYVSTYINEEIKMEGLVRKIPAFTRFLRLAALTNTQLLNFAEIAGDVGVSAATIREYYAILEDTLIGSTLEPWARSVKRKAVATSKFYFFDCGVAHALAETTHLDRNSDLYGRSFEHWVHNELQAYLSYRRRPEKLRFWRSQDKKEVDFIIGNDIAIEVKATRKLAPADFSGLKAIRDENILKKFIVVSHDPVDIVNDGIHRIHWKTFVKQLWSDELIGV